MRYAHSIPNGFSRMASLRSAKSTNRGSQNCLVFRLNTSLLPNHRRDIAAHFYANLRSTKGGSHGRASGRRAVTITS